MVEGGIDILTVSRFARRKNISITARFYVHTKAENTKQQAAESFGRLVTSVA